WMVDKGNGLVQKADQRAHKAALGLAFFAEKEHVVPGDQGEVDLGNDGGFIADDAGKQLLAAVEHAEEVVADLFFDGLGNPTTGTQLFQGGRSMAWGGHEVLVSEESVPAAQPGPSGFIVPGWVGTKFTDAWPVEPAQTQRARDFAVLAATLRAR